MKILHTADWHLGKKVNEMDMLEDQAYIMNQLIDVMKEKEIDLVLMAGDVYDRSVPPKEAVLLLNKILGRINQEVKVPILMIAGNHDSNERLEFGSTLLSNSDVFIEGILKPETTSVTFGDVTIYLMPFADHVRVRHELQNEDITTIEKATQAQLDNITSSNDYDPSQKNILVMHGYVMNQTPESLEESDSERHLSIGAVEYVDASLFDDFDYVALGHLHKAQKVKRETIRYSGSPLKYSKSEVNHQKKVYIIDTDNDMAVEPVPLIPKRDMRVIKGTFEELTKQKSEDYVFIELTDDTYIIDAMSRLRKHYPNAMSLEYINIKRDATVQEEGKQVDVKGKETDDLFKDFYEKQMGKPLDEKREKIMYEILNEVKQEEDA